MVIEESRSDGDPQAVKNRMNALIWAASKMKPDKYGDRLDISMTTTVDIRGALEAAKKRIHDVLDISKTQLIESTIGIDSRATGLEPVETADLPILSLEDLLS